jgi:AraC-like DNA-binding protein
MIFMNDSSSNGNAGQRAEMMASAYREELTERIGRAVPQDGDREPLPGLRLTRVSSTPEPAHGVAVRAFCVIAQGTKEIYLGEERYQYDPYHYLLSTVELPIVIQTIEASPEKPYLSLRLELDAPLVASVLLEAAMPSRPRGSSSARASAGDQSARLQHLAVLGGHTDRVARAIERLRNDFNKPLRIEGLAKEFGMSSSGFHEHFKAVTAMSPLQFQKQLRLQEARRLLLGEDLDAATAGYRVGYEDASQFSKDYKRFFGEPPMRDVERLREVARAGAAL